jgi:hypothetical protein
MGIVRSDVSEERVAAIFGMETIRELGTLAATSRLITFLACGFFHPEDGGDMLLRNVGSNKTHIWRYIQKNGILHNHRRETLKFYISYGGYISLAQS